jgi:CubicO group peptidase (beta-lactamase class C family)
VLVKQCEETLYFGSKGGRSNYSLYNIASVSKQFTAAAILRLEEMDLVSIHDTYNTHVLNGHSSGHRFTLHHLMTHTAGLARNSSSMIASPGSRWSYSNYGFTLLRRVIDAKTGNAKEFLQTELLDKAGMSNSHSRSWSGPGSIYSTAEDMYRWERSLNTSLVLSDESRQKMLTNYRSSYGYGIQVGTKNGHLAHWHHGSYNGYISRWYRFPDDDAMFVVLTRGGVSYGLISDLISTLTKE